MSEDKRVLIIGLDGLRPDLVQPELMPVLAGLVQRGTVYSRFYATYPPITRSCAASFSTGTNPGRHGVVNNKLFCAGFGADGVVDVGNHQALRAFAERVGQPCLLTPSLGERLAAAGKRLAVAGTSSAGASSFWQTHDPSLIVNPASDYGYGTLARTIERYGPVPEDPPGTKLGRVGWITRVLIDDLLPNPDNDVIVLWLGEPDTSQHHYGLGSSEARHAMQAVDSSLKEVLAAIDRLGQRDELELLVVSDHGHSHVLPAPGLHAALEQASRELGVAADYAGVGEFVFARTDHPPRLPELRKLSAWFRQQAWCDVVFAHPVYAADLPGTVDLSVVTGPILHDRAPLLSISSHWTHAINGFGVPGGVQAVSYGHLLSAHCVASPYEMRAFCLGVGPSFAPAEQVSTGSGVIDIAPTVLGVLGLSAVDGFDGSSLIGRRDVGEIVEQVGSIRISVVGEGRYVEGSFPT